MKKIILKAFALLLCFSSLTFCGCSKSGTKPIDLSFYLASTVTGKYFSSEKNAKTFDTSAIYSNKLNYQLIDEYYSISFNTNKSYMYKMFIDYIEVTVYTNQTLDSQMDITLSISNLAAGTYDVIATYKGNEKYQSGRLKVDDAGLDEIDHQFLMAIIDKFNGGPVGVETIASSIGEEISTIEDVIEPYLLQHGYIKRTARGRVVTKIAYEHLGVTFQDRLF